MAVPKRKKKVEEAVFRIRQKMGETTITKAGLLDNEKGAGGRRPR